MIQYIYIYIYIVIHRQICFVLSELISVARQYIYIYILYICRRPDKYTDPANF